MSDLIRRKDAVSRISDLLTLELRAERLPTWDEVYNALAELPSAEPTADVVVKDTNVRSKWIPVTERLPEYGTFVLVSDIYMPEPTIAQLLPDKSWEDQHYNWSSFECVTAWMPLPEPYRDIDMR